MNKLNILAQAIACVLLLFFAQNDARADTHETVLLTIEFASSETGDASPKLFSRADLEALPEESFTTTTNWTSGSQTFIGVPLSAVLESLAITSGQMELIAVNDYSITIPVDDPTNKGAIIAYLLNGKEMTPRDKGPLWLVYNYDSDPMYQTETVYSRSIWQLDRIVISR